MSTTPPTSAPLPQPPSGGGTNKILLGCGIGCGALLLLVLIAFGVFWVKVIGPAAEATKEIEGILKQNQTSVDAIAALDSSYPSSVGADLGVVDLLPSQVDGYIAIRTALEAEAAAVAQARSGLASAFDMSKVASGGPGAMSAVFGMMGSMFGGASDLVSARGALLASAAEALEGQAIGPTEFSRLIEVIEWRFLENEGALPVALSSPERSDWMKRKAEAGFVKALLDGAGSNIGGTDRAQMERKLEEAEERLDDLRALASERMTLSDATRRVLEIRRAELQSLPVPGLVELTMLDETSNPLEDMQGLGGMGH
jgi:hypothetical protein